MIASGGAFYVTHHTNAGRLWWHKAKLVIPIIKRLCHNLYITRSLHTMGVLTRAGVPILNTISITAQISGNILYKNMWLGVYEEVRQGKKIASSLSRYDLMPSNVVQMIRSGEDSGIMIVAMGVMVGFIAMSIILPIFKMSSVVAGR